MSLLRTLRRNGYFYSAAIVFNRLVPAWLFRCRWFVVYELDGKLGDLRHGPTRDQAPDAPQIEVRRCGDSTEYDDVEELTYFRRGTASGATTACRAEVEGRLAGGFWAAADAFDESELGLRIRLEPQQARLFAALVHRDFRRMGIHSRMLRFMLADLQSQGRTEAFVAVNPTNVGSNRVHAQHALATTGSVFVARLFCVAVCWTRGRIRCDRWHTWNATRKPMEIRCRAREAQERGTPIAFASPRAPQREVGSLG